VTRFTVVAGIPEIEAEWGRLVRGMKNGTLTRVERRLANKFAKAVAHLGDNPSHSGLQSHEIKELSARYGQKVFESYLENNTPAAGRLFWVYGPKRHYITVIGVEPHPDDSVRGYRRVLLSALPSPGDAE
jgi:hypothetical protein